MSLFISNVNTPIISRQPRVILPTISYIDPIKARVMIDDWMISILKTYFPLNEVAKLAVISKIWNHTLSSAFELILINPTNAEFIGATKHLNKKLLKHISINTDAAKRDVIAADIITTKTIIDFFANLLETRINNNVKLCSIKIYNPYYFVGYQMSRHVYKYNPNINIVIYPLNSKHDLKHDLKHNLKHINAPIDRPHTEDFKKVEFDQSVGFVFYSIYCFYKYEQILEIHCDSLLHFHCTHKMFNEILKKILTKLQLRYLNLIEIRNLTRQCFQYLCDMNESNLYFLSLKRCHLLTDETLKYIATKLSRARLECFAARDCIKITDDDIEQLFSAIRETNLKLFDISGCSLVENVFIDSTKMSKKIEFLSLQSCEKITEVGLKVLLEGLSSTNIVSLNLANTNITDDTICILMERLKDTNIQHLNLGASSLSDFNLCALVEALKDNDFISFDLSGTNIYLTDDNMSLLLLMINS